jgi:hypothetical protein
MFSKIKQVHCRSTEENYIDTLCILKKIESGGKQEMVCRLGENVFVPNIFCKGEAV